MSSVGSQSLWILVTWLLWIIGAGILNGAAPPGVLVKNACGDVVYCGQIRAFFGEFLISFRRCAVWCSRLWRGLELWGRLMRVGGLVCSLIRVGFVVAACLRGAGLSFRYRIR